MRLDPLWYLVRQISKYGGSSLCNCYKLWVDHFQLVVCSQSFPRPLCWTYNNDKRLSQGKPCCKKLYFLMLEFSLRFFSILSFRMTLELHLEYIAMFFINVKLFRAIAVLRSITVIGKYFWNCKRTKEIFRVTF